MMISKEEMQEAVEKALKDLADMTDEDMCLLFEDMESQASIRACDLAIRPYLSEYNPDFGKLDLSHELFL